MNKKKKNIKSSSLSLRLINAVKIEKLNSFIYDYSLAVNFYVDFLFENAISFKTKKGTKTLDIKNDLLDCPSFLSTKDIIIDSDLSARALSCAITQACNIVKSAISKRKKILFILKKLREKKKRTRKFLKLLRKTIVKKPNLTIVNPELRSLCCEYQEPKRITYFNGIIILKSIGKKYGKIILPIKYTDHSKKLKQMGKLCGSFQVSKKEIKFRYDINLPELKEDGKIVGADQGIVTCVTLSDSQTTQKCNHGHDLRSIVKKITRKKQGSKAFHRAKEHQKNYINWSINQLNLKDIKELRLEKLSNFRHKKNVGKFLNHFGESLIRRKLLDVSILQGVLVVEQNSAYRSRRCSKCGYVDRRNRKKKLFSCKRCLYKVDADYNASCNHEQDLPSAENLRLLLKEKKFFWKAEGFFNLEGQEVKNDIGVPDTKRNRKT